VQALRIKEYSINDFNLTIYSEIPTGSGLASSAALQVSLVAGLNALFELGLGRRDIAEIAYYSEHDVMGIPCGRLDQYGSAMGGITLIETKPPFNTKTFVKKDLLFTVLDSGIRHSTGSIHPVRISELKQGIKELMLLSDLPGDLRTVLTEDIYNLEWERLDCQRLEPHLHRINKVFLKRILFTLKMHYSTMLALKLLGESNIKIWDEVESFLQSEYKECLGRSVIEASRFAPLLGGLVNYQHVLLRDLYDVSLPQLEVIRSKALEAGAYGVKISGAGLGGSLLALVGSKEQAFKVLENTSGFARNAWVVNEDEGVRVEWEK
jgi:galactokinase